MSLKGHRNANDKTLNATAPSHAQHVLYGTPLPAYDPNNRDDGSYVPVWKQEVTDERGRKRLHGAFTGGWSAGYYNTVGSKEGWTPSSFISSRTKRAKIQEDASTKVQSIDDFMDDEDRAEIAASQRLETQDSFAGLGVTHAARLENGMFGDIFRPAEETIGSRLLQKMGWKPGQGVGAKISRQAKDDKHGVLHLFAPENTRMISFSRKQDRKGLAFQSEARLEQPVDLDPDPENENNAYDHADERDARILQGSQYKVKKAPKQKGRTGFGIGVLNDTGSDEEDPYALGPQIEHHRTKPSRQKKKGGVFIANPSSATKFVVNLKARGLQVTAMTALPRKKCHDGRESLQGFVLGSGQELDYLQNPFPPPTIPTGWQPARASSPNHASIESFQSTADAARQSQLDPKSRANLLGEQQLPGKSVFDFLSASARSRLASATGNQALPAALGEGPPPGFNTSEAAKHKSLWDLVPNLDKHTANAALQRSDDGWMPYGEDEAKRARYRQFIELRAGRNADLPGRHASQSIEEWAAELREFAQAAEVFKPVSGLIASRFTTSTSKPKLASDALQDLPASPENEDPAEKAAKMNMFGPLTRNVENFLPTRLLCKRFGVRPPAVQPEDGAATAHAFAANSVRSDVVSQVSLDRMRLEDRAHSQNSAMDTSMPASEIDVQQVRPHDPVEVDWERNDAIEGRRAGEEMFRAIFGSDDEST